MRDAASGPPGFKPQIGLPPVAAAGDVAAMFGGRNRIGLVVLAAVIMVAASARAASPLPRFASLASNKVYLRQGPSYKHRILWVYRRKGLPVEIVAEFDVWRKVTMPDGTQGWVHVAMLSSDRTIVVTGKTKIAIRAGARADARILVLAEPGVIAKLEDCDASACEVDVAGTDGWIDKTNIWGVRPVEDNH